MPFPILGGKSITDAAYSIANSCRFNDGDSPELKDSASDAAPSGTRTKFTWSIWFKRGNIGSTQTLGAASYSSDDEGYFQINSDDQFEWDSTESADGNLITNRKFRDCSAWYHIVVAVDTTQGTAANRMKVYVNGTQETSFATETYPDEDKGVYWNVGGTYYPYVGKKHGGEYFDGYITEVANIDNAQLAATSFGEFDENSPTIWKPIDISDLTFGTAGYWLDMEDSSDFGNDVSGVGNDFAVANLAAVDQATDTPTNNFATWNPLHKTGTTAQQPLSEGNCMVTSSDDALDRIASTIAVTKGKWYAEFKRVDGSGDRMGCGVLHYPIPANSSNSSFALGDGRNGEIGRWSNTFGVKFGGEYQTDNSSVSFTSSSDGTVFGVFMDLDNQKLYFSKDGTLVSSTGKALTDNGEPYAFQVINEQASTQANFGGCPSFALSSAVADANGYGNFEYDPSHGGASDFDSAAKDFLALCTQNVATNG